MLLNEKIQNYAIALFDISESLDQKREFYDQFIELKEIFNQNYANELIFLFTKSSLEKKQKTEIIEKVFEGFSKYIINFLLLLIDRNYFFQVKKIIAYFIKLSSKELKIVNGFIYTTSSLSKEQIKKIEDFYSKKLKLEVFLKNIIDKNLIKGIKVHINDFVFENSVVSSISELKKELLTGVK